MLEYNIYIYIYIYIYISLLSHSVSAIYTNGSILYTVMYRYYLYINSICGHICLHHIMYAIF